MRDSSFGLSLAVALMEFNVVKTSLKLESGLQSCELLSFLIWLYRIRVHVNSFTVWLLFICFRICLIPPIKYNTLLWDEV